MTETATNSGSGFAKSTNTRFYLSLDTLQGSSDTLLTGTRFVPSLTAGAASTGTTSVTIPSGTPAGLYYVLAWADASNSMAERSDANNSSASAGQIQVTP